MAESLSQRMKVHNVESFFSLILLFSCCVHLAKTIDEGYDTLGHGLDHAKNGFLGLISKHLRQSWFDMNVECFGSLTLFEFNVELMPLWLWLASP